VQVLVIGVIDVNQLVRPESIVSFSRLKAALNRKNRLVRCEIDSKQALTLDVYVETSWRCGRFRNATQGERLLRGREFAGNLL
jgi:hypothetical protein